MAKMMVTGGAGFIGSHIVDALLKRGDDVVVLDNFSTGHHRNLAHVIDRITLIEADITDPASLAGAFDGVDTVFHEAALSSVPRSVKEPDVSFHSIATGTLNVLKTSMAAGVRKVILAASSAAYGNAQVEIKHEDLPVEALSPYAAAKISAEKIMQAFGEVYDIDTVCLRYFNIFGPRQDPDSAYAAVIPLFGRAMIAGRRPFVTGDGDQSRDFTYVANAVQANLLAADAGPLPAGRVINIATGRRIFIPEIITEANKILGTDLEPEFGDARPGDIKHSLASVERAGKELGYTPETDFNTGLQRTLEWMKQEHGVTTS
jgi:nucleoside-diphosphate-sugar epimerase